MLQRGGIPTTHLGSASPEVWTGLFTYPLSSKQYDKEDRNLDQPTSRVPRTLDALIPFEIHQKRCGKEKALCDKEPECAVLPSYLQQSAVVGGWSHYRSVTMFFRHVVCWSDGKPPAAVQESKTANAKLSCVDGTSLRAVRIRLHMCWCLGRSNVERSWPVLCSTAGVLQI